MSAEASGSGTAVLGRLAGPFTRFVRLTSAAGAIVGLVAGLCLIAGVEARAWRLLSRTTVQSLFQLHDILIIGQAVLLIPFAAAVGRAVG